MSRVFLDTNILVYCFDLRDPQKQAKAHELVRSIIRRQEGVISTQVLQEFAYVAQAKLRHSIDQVLQEMTVLESFEMVQVTPKIIRQGVELLQQHKIHFWDAIVLASARESKCDTLYSEDFQNGGIYDNLLVVNPLA